MSYDNLDQKDREICEALEGGMSHEEVMEKFDVDSSKVAQLQSVVDEPKDVEDTEPAQEVEEEGGENSSEEESEEVDESEEEEEE